MKKRLGEKVIDFTNWLSVNIVFAFFPFFLIHFFKFVSGFEVGLENIISDYAGLGYGTSVVLIACVADFNKIVERSKIVVNLLLIYGMIALMLTMNIYFVLNILDNLVNVMLKRLFIVLTVIMVLNIIIICALKIKELIIKVKN